MRNGDPEYVRDLERALASAENEIKALEREISNQSRIMDDMQEQINSPLHMGELPRHLLSDDFLRQRDARTMLGVAEKLKSLERDTASWNNSIRTAITEVQNMADTMENGK